MPALWSRASSAASCLLLPFSLKDGAVGREQELQGCDPGCHLGLLSPSALPHQLQSGAVTDVTPASEEERSQRALDLRGVAHMLGVRHTIMCLV